MKIKITFYIFFLIILAKTSVAQDVHLSMFNKAPLLLNPANTANFEGKWRAALNYRKQGDFSTNPYSTGMASFDMPFFVFGRISGIGLTFLNDNSANISLNTSELILSTSHFIKVSSASYLHMGFGFSLVNKRISYNSLTFPNQFDNNTGVFNSSFENFESFNTFNSWYLDLSWGIMYSYIKPELKFQAGIAMLHYNQPSIGFISDEYKIKPKYQSHFYVEKKLSNTMYVKPKLLYVIQSKATEMVFGSDLGFITNHDAVKNIYFGAYFRGGFYRNSDAMIFNTGMFYKNFKFNMSYDYSFNLRNTEYRNDVTFEIAIIYVFPRIELEKRAIQCEIF